MAVKATEIRSGAFVILAVLAFTVLVFSVGNLKSRFQARVQYRAHVTDAKFLKAHDAVTYGGLRVGEIESVGVSPDRFGQVRVILSVNKGIPVKEDSILVLKQDGLLGAKYLEIGPGTPAAKWAAAGADLRAVVPPAITDMAAAIEKPIAKLDELIGHLNAVLGSSENQRNIGKMLDEARKLLEQLQDHSRTIAENTSKTAEQVQMALQENRPLVTALLKNTDALVAHLAQTADHLDQVLKDADGLLVQNNKNIYETIRAMRDTAYHMEQASKRIRANPSVLLFGASETPEERRLRDETELRMQGRVRRYDKEDVK